MKITAVDLKEKRVARGLTQGQLAEMLGVYPQHVYKIEAGLRNVTAPLVASCVDIFGSLRIAKGERVYLVTPDGGPLPDSPDPKPRRRDAYASLSPTEKIVRLAKECGEVRACADDLPKCLLNPQARREHLKRLLKEGIDVDMILDALMESASPEVLAEAAAAAEDELAWEVRSA